MIKVQDVLSETAKKEYETITIQLDVVLEPKDQAVVAVIEEYWKTLELDGERLFQHWTREQCLKSILELGLSHTLKDKANFCRMMMGKKET